MSLKFCQWNRLAKQLPCVLCVTTCIHVQPSVTMVISPQYIVAKSLAKSYNILYITYRVYSTYMHRQATNICIRNINISISLLFSLLPTLGGSLGQFVVMFP